MLPLTSFLRTIPFSRQAFIVWRKPMPEMRLHLSEEIPRALHPTRTHALCSTHHDGFRHGDERAAEMECEWEKRY